MKTAIKSIVERETLCNKSEAPETPESSTEIPSYKKWLTDEVSRSCSGLGKGRRERVEQRTLFCCLFASARNFSIVQCDLSETKAFFCRCEVICERTNASNLSPLCVIPLYNFFISLRATTKNSSS